MKKIKVCLGVGPDQLFPQYITIELPSEENEEIKDDTKKEIKKRGRKPKKQ